MGNNTSITNSTDQQQTECERNLGNNPALKPLCNPEFLSKVKTFFDELRTVDDQQKLLDVKEADIVNLVNQAERLDKYYRETSNLLKLRERNLENKLRRMGLITNTGNSTGVSNIPIKLLDNSYNELVSEYDSFINDLENINTDNTSMSSKSYGITPKIHPIYQPQSKFVPFQSQNINLPPKYVQSTPYSPKIPTNTTSTPSSYVPPVEIPMDSFYHKFSIVTMNSFQTSGGPEKTKMNDVNGANIIPYTQINGTIIFLLGYDPNESIWKAFGGKKDLTKDTTVRAIAFREVMEESCKYDRINKKYLQNTSFLPLKQIKDSLNNGNGVVIPKYDRQRTKLWNNFYFIEIDFDDWKQLTYDNQSNITGLNDIRITGIENNEVNRIKWFKNDEIYGSNKFKIHPPLAAIFRDHYNELITKL